MSSAHGFLIEFPPDMPWELRLSVVACALYIDYAQFGVRTREGHAEIDVGSTQSKSPHGSCWPLFNICACNCVGCVCSL